MAVAGTKITKTPDDIKAKICKWLLTQDADRLRRTDFHTLRSKVLDEFKFPVAESTLKTIVGSLGIELRNGHGKRKGVKERNGIGNARRIMFLAREVRKIMQELDIPGSEMMAKLCGGLELGEVEPNPT